VTTTTDSQDSPLVPVECRFPIIGVVHSPFREPPGTPIQPSRASGAEGVVQVYAPYLDGLRDLEGFERIWLLYWLHRASTGSLLVTPFLDPTPRGVFATRAPSRPAPIGMSAVRLRQVRGSFLDIEGVDIVDGTPLLDIKPYVPAFDSYPRSKAGWFDSAKSKRRLADRRFQPEGRGDQP